EVVERRVVVHVLRVTDEAVVRDDRNLRVGGGLEDARERRAVDRGDDQGLCTLGDHVLDLADLRGDVVLCVLQVDGEALLLERRLEGVAVSDPALRGLRGHRDADEAAFAATGSAVTGGRASREAYDHGTSSNERE